MAIRDFNREYQDGARKMTDGIYAESASRMIGDPNFHRHNNIDAEVAERWKEDYSDAMLGAVTRAMARTLGYTISES